MKIIVCLLATVYACNATFLNLLGGGGGSGNGDPGHSHYHGQSYGGPPQVFKVIFEQGNGGAHNGGYSYASSNSFGSSDYGRSGEAQIFKVITQNSAGSGPIHGDHSYSAGSSYAPSYHYGGSRNYNSELSEILPQILQLILQDDGFDSSGGGFGSASGGNFNSQLLTSFGESGGALITRSNGQSNSFYSSGHVVEKGELKIMRIEESSHGPPPPSHGW